MYGNLVAEFLTTIQNDEWTLIHDIIIIPDDSKEPYILGRKLALHECASLNSSEG